MCIVDFMGICLRGEGRRVGRGVEEECNQLITLILIEFKFFGTFIILAFEIFWMPLFVYN
jgi:hypothetical protein